MSVAVAEPWFDVDDEADLTHLVALLRDGEIHAPETRAALARMSRCARLRTRSE